MSIVIIGCGYLGYHYAKYYLKKEISTYVLTSGNEYSQILQKINAENVRFFDRNIAELEKILTPESVVIYTAGSINAQNSFEDIYRDWNEIYQHYGRTLQLCAHIGIRKFVLISSAGTVYGDYIDHPFKEGDSLNPLNIYALQKVTFEYLLKIINFEKKLPYLIMRVSNPYGGFSATNRKQGIIDILVRKVLNDERIEFWISPENTYRDFIYIDDFLKISDILIENSEPFLCLNVGSGKTNSLSEIVSIIEKQSGKKILFSLHKKSEANINKIEIDIDRLIKQVGNFPYTSIEQGIKKIFEMRDEIL